MNYKMVVLDMDGTLLTDDKRISDKNMDALKKISDLGIKVVISTGRIFTSAKSYGDLIGVRIPIIASNGAYIREKDRDEVIYAKLLKQEVARKIVTLCHKFRMYCHLFTWDSLYSEKLIYSALYYSKWNKNLPEGEKVNINIIDPSDWNKVIMTNKNLLKAVVTDEDREKVASLRKEVSKLDVEVTSSSKNNIEIMDKGVSKGKAVEYLGKYYNIRRDEIICIGDSENDISMIKYAGLGIAMGNAEDEVKDASKFVTLSNEEDGVSYAIEKFLLKD
ncbi:MAG: Cof-type HAD-IIB family hydrolase [Clostridiales bacterium]|nr:Cof-type HAD-IIB family hydrolase [Clostridiales bacterium]